LLRRIFIFAVIAGIGASTASGETYKTPFSVACSDIWPAVKTTLADRDHYAKVVINDEKMKADYQPKHTVHVDISGTLLQRMNHVKLIPKDEGCELDVASNWSGWGHDDQADFRKRVSDNLTKRKAPEAQPAEAAPAAEPLKPGTTAEAQKPQ
jgi:hypothetical protein